MNERSSRHFQKAPDCSARARLRWQASQNARKPSREMSNRTRSSSLWDLTIPVQPAVGLPRSSPLYKYAISEGGYVATGNYDIDANFNGGFTYSPTMGTLRPDEFSKFLPAPREESWVFDSTNNNSPAGSTDFTGTAVVAADGEELVRRWHVHSVRRERERWWPRTQISPSAPRGSRPDSRPQRLPALTRSRVLEGCAFRGWLVLRRQRVTLRGKEIKAQIIRQEIGRSAPAFTGVSKRAKAFEGNEHQNPLLGVLFPQGTINQGAQRQ